MNFFFRFDLNIQRSLEEFLRKIYCSQINAIQFAELLLTLENQNTFGKRLTVNEKENTNSGKVQGSEADIWSFLEFPSCLKLLILVKENLIDFEKSLNTFGIMFEPESIKY